MNNIDYSALAVKVTALLEKKCAENKIAGVSAVLVDEDKVVFTCAAGLANVESDIPATAEMVGGIASVSKVFTATAIMQLVEQGKLNINEPVSKYIPEFSMKTLFENSPPVRVIDLMTHHSGLPRDWLNHFYTYQPELFQNMIGYLKDEYVSNPPGYFYSYSNIAVSVLGIVLERVSGVPFKKYMEDNVFKPLHMEHTGYSKSYDFCELYAATYGVGCRPMPELPPRDLPGGGLNSSVADMAAFISMYLCGGVYGGKRLLSEATIEQMFAPQVNDVAMSFQKKMGLNWHLGRPKLEYGGRVAHHGGALVCFRSEMCLLPDHGLGVAILSNSSCATQAILDIADFVLQKALRIKKGIAPVEPKAATLVLKPPLVTAGPEGDFATSWGYIKIYHSENTLMAKIGTQLHELILQEGGAYIPKLPFMSRGSDMSWMKLQFCYDPRYNTHIMLVNGWPDGEGFELEPLPEIWRQRRGTYKAYNRMPEENFTDIPGAFKIFAKGEMLFMQVMGKGYNENRVLKIVDENTAMRLGFGQSEREFIHVMNDNGEVLSHMGIRYRKVR